MMNDTHDLLHELPEYHDKIVFLQTQDPEFRGLVQEYDALDKRIQEAELAGLPLSDHAFEDLKKRRLALKDVLFERLRAA